MSTAEIAGADPAGHDVVRQAQEIIQQDRLQRGQQCGAELDELLRKYNCSLDVVLQPAGPLEFRIVIIVKAL